MKEQNKMKMLPSRRRFIGTAAAAAATLSIIPIGTGCSGSSIPPYVTGEGTPNSEFGGVQIGAITFSFRDVQGGIEDTLQACIEAGLSSIELMSNGIEEWCGAPAVVRAPRRPQPQQGAPGGAPQGGMPGGQQQQTYTEEEYAELERQAAESQEVLRQWRLSAPLEKFEELGQMFRDAGVDIHLLKWSPSSWSDEEIDYAFLTAKAMAA